MKIKDQGFGTSFPVAFMGGFHKVDAQNMGGNLCCHASSALDAILFVVVGRGTCLEVQSVTLGDGLQSFLNTCFLVRFSPKVCILLLIRVFVETFH